MVRTLTIPPTTRGLHDITTRVAEAVTASAKDGALAADSSGLCTVFVRHTSASIIIQENTDPSVRRDLEAWMARMIPDGDRAYTHDEEGPDDMPSHIRSAITATSVSIPIIAGRLALGRWQAIYLYEHRTQPHERQVVVHVGA